MFPFSSVKMNQMYGNMQPIDLNGGMNDYSGLINALIQYHRNRNMQSTPNMTGEMRNETDNSFPLFGTQNGANPVPPQVSFDKPVNNSKQVERQTDKGSSKEPGRFQAPLSLDVDPLTGHLRSFNPGQAEEHADKDRQFEEGLSFKENKLNTDINMKKQQLAEKTTTDTGKLGIQAQRADTYRFKATHPDWKAEALPGGTLVFYDPQDPTKSYDTGMDSGKMSEQDKLELIGEQRQQDILTRGDVNTNLQTLRGQQVLDQIGARVAGQKDVNENKPQRGELPTQTKTRQNLTAHEIINRFPEYNPYIVFNGDGTVGVKRSTPPDVSKRINDILYPSTTPSTTKTGRPGSTPNNIKPSGTTPNINITAPSKVAPSNTHIQVQDKDGKKFWADSKDVDTLLKQGYTKVGGDDENNNEDNNETQEE